MASFFIVGDERKDVTVGGATFDVVVEWLRELISRGSFVDDPLLESRLSAADLGILNLTHVKESTEARMADALSRLVHAEHHYWSDWIERPAFAEGLERFRNESQDWTDAVNAYTKSCRDEIGLLVKELESAIARRSEVRGRLPVQAQLIELLRVIEREKFIREASSSGIELGDTQRVYQWARSIGYSGQIPF